MSHNLTIFVPSSIITTLFVGEHVCVYYKEVFGRFGGLNRINACLWMWDLTQLMHVPGDRFCGYTEAALRELADDGYRVLEFSKLKELHDQNKDLFSVKD